MRARYSQPKGGGEGKKKVGGAASPNHYEPGESSWIYKEKKEVKYKPT